MQLFFYIFIFWKKHTYCITAKTENPGKMDAIASFPAIWAKDGRDPGIGVPSVRLFSTLRFSSF